MSKAVIRGAVAFATMAVVRITLAQEPTAPPLPAPPGETIATLPDVEFQFAPRFWYMYSAFGGAKPANPFSVANVPGVIFPMAGGSISARPGALPDTTFVLTGLYGTTTETAFDVCAAVCGASAATATLSQQTSRYDFELLGQTAIPGRDWAWIGGARWEYHTSSGTLTNLSFNPNAGPIFTPRTQQISRYTIKGGLAWAVPLNSDGNLRLFSNVMLVGGFVVDKSRVITNMDFLYGEVGPDISVGVQYAISPGVVADLRYRGVVAFEVAAPPGFARYLTQHGPMIGVNFKF